MSADILYYTTDLMFSALVLQEAAQQGAKVRLVGKFAELLPAIGESAPRLLLLDLGAPPINWPDLGQQLTQCPTRPRVLAYGPHVQEASLAAAHAAGCDQVLTRGQFHREFASLIQ